MPMYKQPAKQEFHYEPCCVSKKSFAFDGYKFGEMIGGSFSNCVSFNMSEEELGEQRINSQSSSSQFSNKSSSRQYTRFILDEQLDHSLADHVQCLELDKIDEEDEYTDYNPNQVLC